MDHAEPLYLVHSVCVCESESESEWGRVWLSVVLLCLCLCKLDVWDRRVGEMFAVYTSYQPNSRIRVWVMKERDEDTDNLFVWFIHLFCFAICLSYTSHFHIYDYSASVQIDLLYRYTSWFQTGPTLTLTTDLVLRTRMLGWILPVSPCSRWNRFVWRCARVCLPCQVCTIIMYGVDR